MNGGRQRVLAGILLGALCLPSCEALTKRLTQPGEEPPLDADESLMATGGPQTAIDLGEGGEQLLTRYQKIKAERDALDTRLSQVTQERDDLQRALNHETERLAGERNQRAGAEAQRETMRQEVVDYQAKILALSLERAKLQQEVLRLEIIATERQIAELQGAQGAPSRPLELGTDAGARPDGRE